MTGEVGNGHARQACGREVDGDGLVDVDDPVDGDDQVVAVPGSRR